MQSKYESKNDNFFPVYSLSQTYRKAKHTLGILVKLGKNITRYLELPEAKQTAIDMSITERLVGHSGTKLYNNIMSTLNFILKSRMVTFNTY